jgi:hypothetical protein
MTTDSYVAAQVGRARIVRYHRTDKVEVRRDGRWVPVEHIRVTEAEDWDIIEARRSLQAKGDA